MVGDNRAIRPVESEQVSDSDEDKAAATQGDDWDEADEEAFVDELKPGTKLFHGQFTIDRFLNSGGFGITYLARDSLERPVVIKECFPGSFCRRSTSIVRARSRAHQHEFRSIVRLFVQEARSLSKLIHPNIVGVHQVFEDNDTAYMAIDFVDGQDLLAIIEDESIELTPDQVISYLTKLLAAVDFVHRSGVLHRDISPDNILINQEGEPILIDFGAAREEASKTSRALSALRVVKDGYSPQEFYISGSLQSDSSDLYALAASFYHVITGFAPPNSQARLAAIADDSAVDPYIPLEGRHQGYPPNFLEAIDKAMNVLPRDRIKSARAWLDLIEDGGRAAAERETARMSAIDDAVTEMVTVGTVSKKQKKVEKAPAQVEPTVLNEPEKKTAEAVATVVAKSPKPAKAAGASGNQSRGAGVFIGVGVAALAAVAAGYIVLGGSDTPEEASQGTQTAEVSPTTPETAVTTEASINGSSATPETGEASVDSGANGPELAVVEPETAAGPAVEAETEEPANVTLGEEAGSGEASAVAEVETEVETETEVEGPAVGDGSEIASSAENNAPETEAEVSNSEESAEPEQEADPVEVAAVEPETVEPPVTTPESQTTPEPTPLPEVTGEVLAEQITSAGWDVQLPFETELVEISGRSFPKITSVDASALDAEANPWIKEGAIIFAVNDEWVTNADEIRGFISQSISANNDNFLNVSVRIRPSESEPFEQVDMTLPAMRVVELANGAKFRATYSDNRWKTIVDEEPNVPGNALKVGDEIISENVTSQGVRYAQSVEAFIPLLTRRNQNMAVFSVVRDGSVIPEVAMPLATK